MNKDLLQYAGCLLFIDRVTRQGVEQQLRQTISTLEQSMSIRTLEIEQAPAPSRPIERSIASPGVLARILVAKFADHQPLYRQSVIYARQGVELDRSTMARWVGACGALVEPLVDQLRRYVLAPGNAHARRKINELHENRATATTTEALRRIGAAKGAGLTVP